MKSKIANIYYWAWIFAVWLCAIFIIWCLFASGIVYDKPPLANILGYVATVIWFIPFLIFIKTHRTESIGAWITHSRSFVAVGLGLAVSIWVSGLTALVEVSDSVLFGLAPIWKWPFSVSGLDAHVLLPIFMGSATLAGLLIAIARIQDAAIPRPMHFNDALERAADFLEGALKHKKKVRMCAYYPCIGAVNQDEYPEEYARFRNLVTTTTQGTGIQYMFLPLKEPVSPESEISDQRAGDRPRDAIYALRAFAKEYYRREWEREQKFQRALEQNVDTKNSITRDQSGATYEVEVVPDYHFLISASGGKYWDDGFILLPLAPPGIPYNPTRNASPPFLAIPLRGNRSVAKALNSLFETLASRVIATEVITKIRALDSMLACILNAMQAMDDTSSVEKTNGAETGRPAKGESACRIWMGQVQALRRKFEIYRSKRLQGHTGFSYDPHLRQFGQRLSSVEQLMDEVLSLDTVREQTFSVRNLYRKGANLKKHGQKAYLSGLSLLDEMGSYSRETGERELKGLACLKAP